MDYSIIKATVNDSCSIRILLIDLFDIVSCGIRIDEEEKITYLSKDILLDRCRYNNTNMKITKKEYELLFNAIKENDPELYSKVRFSNPFDIKIYELW